MTFRPPPLLLLLALTHGGCNIESTVTGKDQAGPGFDSGELGDSRDSATTSPEACNGRDDDGDGDIDEGYPDQDGDGIADCVDPSCPALAAGDAGPVPVVTECADGPPTPSAVVDPWRVRTLWAYGGDPVADSASTPLVAILEDTDGDGIIDADDASEVVVLVNGQTEYGSYLVALDGATGVERWRYTGVAPYSQASIADVDGDGRPEVLVADPDNHVLAVSAPGALLWRSAEKSDAPYAQGIVTAADLDADGTPEVIADNLVLEGIDGSARFRMPVDGDRVQMRGAAVADLDLDGAQELLYAGSAWDRYGAQLWTSGDENFHGNWAVPVQADADPEPEIVFVGESYSLYEPDGTQVFSVPYQRGSYAGVPCAGDFDGDGETEVAWGSWGYFLMFELDGTMAWQTPNEDSSCCGGCAGYDLDGDGTLEILYNDEHNGFIFDGATGATRYVYADHMSGTVYEYPVPADLDHDGTTEILFTNNWDSPDYAVVAMQHDGDGWPSLGTTWPIHDFATCNVEPDASLPQHPEPYWSQYEVYRSRVARTTPQADLTVAFTDTCVFDCIDGPALLAIQVGNQGLVDVPEGGSLTLYADDGGALTLLRTVTLPAIPSGAQLAGYTFDLLPDEIGPDGWVARVAGGESVTECSLENNEAAWRDVPCE